MKVAEEIKRIIVNNDNSNNNDDNEKKKKSWEIIERILVKLARRELD